MSGHTPGPWELIGSIRAVGKEGDETDLYCGSIVPTPWRGPVCRIQSVDHIDGISKDEAEANGRLIASAPDLLEALQRMVQLQEISDAWLANRAEFEFARAAIAKATGT